MHDGNELSKHHRTISSNPSAPVLTSRKYPHVEKEPEDEACDRDLPREGINEIDLDQLKRGSPSEHLPEISQLLPDFLVAAIVEHSNQKRTFSPCGMLSAISAIVRLRLSLC